MSKFMIDDGSTVTEHDDADGDVSFADEFLGRFPYVGVGKFDPPLITPMEARHFLALMEETDDSVPDVPTYCSYAEGLDVFVEVCEQVEDRSRDWVEGESGTGAYFPRTLRMDLLTKVFALDGTGLVHLLRIISGLSSLPPTLSDDNLVPFDAPEE